MISCGGSQRLLSDMYRRAVRSADQESAGEELERGPCDDPK